MSNNAINILSIALVYLIEKCCNPDKTSAEIFPSDSNCITKLKLTQYRQSILIVKGFVDCAVFFVFVDHVHFQRIANIVQHMLLWKWKALNELALLVN